MLGAAPTGKAVTELKAAGVERSRTFASLANHINQDKPLVELTGGVPGILLGDELTMVHTREAELVLTNRGEGRVRGARDGAQRAACNRCRPAGGSSRSPTSIRTSSAKRLLRLDEVIRQKDTDEGKALNDLAARTPHKWVAYQEKHGRLRGYGLSPRDDTRRRWTRYRCGWSTGGAGCAADLADQPAAPGPEHARASAAASTGRLTGEPVGFQTSEGDTIHAGEKLILKRNDRSLGVDNGTVRQR